MTSGGLESIALAVAQLERENERQVTAHRQNSEVVDPAPSPTPEDNAPAPPRAPTGSSFVTSARTVSAEVFPEKQMGSSGPTFDIASAALLPTCCYPNPPSNQVPPNTDDSLTSTRPSAPAYWAVQPTTTNHHATEEAASSAAAASLNAPALVPSTSGEVSPTCFNKAYQAQSVSLRSANSVVEVRHGTAANPGNLKDLQPYFAPADFATAECPSVPSPSEPLEVGPDDVIFGRGGSSNHHSGNIQYRQLVKACQHAYLAAKRRDKPRIAAGIVLAVRKVGGRFLKKDSDNAAWRDVGNSRAREKTSQALREGAPELRDSSTSKTIGASARSKTATNRQPCTMHYAPGNGLPMKKARGRPKKTENKGIKRSTPPHVPNVMNAGLGLGKHVENDAMIPHPPNTKKQKCASALENLAVAAASRPVPERRAAPHHDFGATPTLSSLTAPTGATSVVPDGAASAAATPQCVPAVSSGDDDDGSSSSFDRRLSSSKPSSVKRGPRIKLLKQRLLTSDE